MSSLWFLAFVLLLSNVLAQPGYLHGWAQCTDFAYTPQGMLDLATMLYNCSANIPSALDPPSYFAPPGQQYVPTNVTIQLALNNLIEVNDLTSTVQLDFYCRLSWKDYRINLPNIWPLLNPECTKDGIDITNYIRNQDPLNFWLPDVVFTDSVEQSVVSEVIKYSVNGSLYWSRHFFMTLAQPQMNFKQFPLDYQNFSMRMQSFSYDDKIMKLYFATLPVMLLYDIQQQQFNIKMNELWTYDSSTAYTTNELFPNLINPFRVFRTAYVNIKFRRQSLGIIYRLALPVTIFLVIVGLSFWANMDQRIDVTLQMLLVTAAMYIIVGSVIPFVGYLTTLDIFITTVFVILSVTVGIHFLTLVLDRKKFKYPLNSFFRDLLVYCFKACWIPLAMALFIIMFSITIPAFVATLCATVVACAVDATAHIPYLQRSFKVSVLNLRVKEKRLNEVLLFSINNPGKVLNSNIRDTVSDDKEDENNPFGKQIRLSRLEQYVLRVTSTYYQDEVVQDIKENRLDELAESQLHSAAVRPKSVFSDSMGPQLADPDAPRPSGASRFVNSGNGAAAVHGLTASRMVNGGSGQSAAAATSNPMMVRHSSMSLDDVIDSDDEDEHGNRISQMGVELRDLGNAGGGGGGSGKAVHRTKSV